MIELSDLQKDVMRLLKSQMEQRGYPSTIRDLAIPTGRSTSVIAYNLDILVDRGLVAREVGVDRTTRLTASGRDYIARAQSDGSFGSFLRHDGSLDAKIICTRCGKTFWESSKSHMICPECIEGLRLSAEKHSRMIGQ